MVARKTQMEREAYFPESTRVITPQALSRLIENLDRFVSALAQREPALWTATQVGELLLANKLSAAQFAGAYTRPLTK